MGITGNEDFSISLHDASVLTARYRAQMTSGQIKGGFFSKSYMTSLLNQSAVCIGFRFYYGFDENNKQVLVLVGVDSDGNDMVDGIILEKSVPCPTICGDGNSLNSD